MTTTTIRAGLDARLHSPTGRGVTLTAAALTWLVAYRLNGPLWDALVYRVMGLEAGSRAGETAHFFGYDTVKISLLLTGSSSWSPCCAPT